MQTKDVAAGKQAWVCQGQRLSQLREHTACYAQSPSRRSGGSAREAPKSVSLRALPDADIADLDKELKVARRLYELNVEAEKECEFDHWYDDIVIGRCAGLTQQADVTAALLQPRLAMSKLTAPLSEGAVCLWLYAMLH